MSPLSHLGRKAADPTGKDALFAGLPEMRISLREITLGPVHALPGDPAKVMRLHGWLLAHPNRDLPALFVFAKPNGTVRIHDGRHRFVAYALAGRESVPVRIARAMSDRWLAGFFEGRAECASCLGLGGRTTNA